MPIFTIMSRMGLKVITKTLVDGRRLFQCPREAIEELRIHQIFRRAERGSGNTYDPSIKITTVHALFPLMKTLLPGGVDHPGIKDTMFPWSITSREESWLIHMHGDKVRTVLGKNYLKRVAFI